MMLAPVMLAISAIVCAALAILEIAVACMLWNIRKSHADRLEDANIALGARIPGDGWLTDYRGVARQNKRIDEATLMRNWRPIAPFRGRWDECGEDVVPVGDYPVTRVKVVSRHKRDDEMVVDETGEAGYSGCSRVAREERVDF